MKPIRRITNIEQLYEDVQNITNVYAIQFILKVHNIKNKNKIEQAIQQVIKECPSFNVYLKKGKFYPQLRPVKIQSVRTNYSTLYNLNLFKRKINLSDHSIEAYLIKLSSDKYLVFRFAHSAIDGKSALLFIQNFTNSLNKKELIDCRKAISEKEFVRELDYYRENEPKFPKLIHNKALPIKRYEVEWRVVQLNTYVPSIIAKLSCLLAQEFKNNQTRIMIPADLRRYDNNNPYVGNLTLPIFLNVGKKDNYVKVNGRLLCSIKDGKELNISNTLHDAYQHVPTLLRRTGIRIGCKAIQQYNKFSIGAIISHLGRIDVDDYSNQYFDVEDFIDLSTQQPLGAFSIVIVEHSHKTNISISYYKNQFTEKYIDKLMKKIRSLA